MDNHITDIKSSLITKIEHSINILKTELDGLRTSRASVSMLTPVTPTIDGKRVHLSHISSISLSSDGRKIIVQVWDPSSIKPVEKAINNANLNLGIAQNGNVITLTVPPITQERRIELAKTCHKLGEDTKIAIRNIARHQKELFIKLHKEHEDIIKQAKNTVQKIVDEYNAMVDKIIKLKESEILIL